MPEKIKTVLIVDDDLNSVVRVKDFLQARGYSVAHVNDGELAQDMIRDVMPDIVLLDIIMPKVDGFTVAKKMRYEEKTKHIPIIVFSAKEGMRELFAIEGIHDYMVKPVDLDALLELVKKRMK